MIKVGDKLCCYKSSCVTTILRCGSLYEIIYIDTIDNDNLRLCIIDDNDVHSYYTIYPDKCGLSYKNWFYLKDISEERKRKILEIEHNI